MKTVITRFANTNELSPCAAMSSVHGPSVSGVIIIMRIYEAGVVIAGIQDDDSCFTHPTAHIT